MQSQSVKFLGVYLDKHLTWNNHIKAICTKISKSLFVINRVKHILPHTALKTLYYTPIHSHLTYGIQAWGNASNINKLMILQKRAVRILNKSGYRDHTNLKKYWKSLTFISCMLPYLCLINNLALYLLHLKITFLTIIIVLHKFAIITRQHRRGQLFLPNYPNIILPLLWNSIDVTLGRESRRTKFK